MRRKKSSRFVRIIAAMAVCLLLCQLNACKRKGPVAASAPANQTPATTPTIATTAPVIPAITVVSPVLITTEEVDRALGRAREFLYRSRRDRQWGGDDPENPRAGTDTALVLRALLQCGEDAQQVRLKSPFERHMDADLASTQALADRLRVSVLLRPDAQTRRRLKLDANFVMTSAMPDGPDAGFHTRAALELRVSFPASAQATLALAEASDRGLEVPIGYWKMADNAWRGVLRKELLRGLSVGPRGASAEDFRPMLRTLDVLATIGGMLPSASADRTPAPDKLFDAALGQLEDHYNDLYRGPGEFEAMETFARIMRSRGIRLVDDHDWYRDGVSLLLAVQKLDGSWGDGVRDTAHAMLFLTRARAPLLFNKLQYASDSRGGSLANPIWNNRPNDLAHLSRWLGDQLEQPFDWQVLSIDAPIEDWFNAPILYISGNNTLMFNADHIAKLKRFIEQGGMIVANAEGNSGSFSTSFLKLGQAMFPAFEFRNLPDDHLVFGTIFHVDKSGVRPVVKGLSNGVRELMLLLPGDPARGWQLNAFNGGKPTSNAQVAANIVGYATEKKFKFKEELFPDQDMSDSTIAAAGAPEFKRPPRPEVDLAELRRQVEAVPAPIQPEPKKSVALAMISADADPAALPPLFELRGAMRLNDTILGVDPIVLGKWTLQRYEIASMASVQFMALDPLQRVEVKRFIEVGGTLFVDASAKPEQAGRFEADIARMFADPKLSFGPGTPADGAIFAAAKDPIRVGRLEGRIAVIVNAHSSQSADILGALLSSRAK